MNILINKSQRYKKFEIVNITLIKKNVETMNER